MKKSITILSMSIMSFLTFGQWSNQNSTISNDLNSVFFLDNNNGWAVGRQGKIIRTTNGGSSWTEQNSGTTQDLNKVFMVNNNVGYAVGKSGTLVKYNGSSWSTVNINYSQPMHGVYFLNENTGWISGDFGRIMMTTDGGSSWTTQMSNATFTNLFHDIHMLSETEGWAVGTSGRVLKYNGTNWSNQSTPASADLNSVHFFNSSNGFMVGKNSKIYYYNGSSWSEHGNSLPTTSYNISSVHFLNQNEAYATAIPGFGGGGIILRYNGNVWSIDYEYTGMATELFYGVNFSPQGKGFAVGAGGIIRTRNSATANISAIEDSRNETAVYPNPFKNELNISLNLNNFETGNVVLFDIRGKQVFSQKFENTLDNSNIHLFELDNLPNGVYFLNISSGDFFKTHKIVKKG
jgi:photosystem II stability/assembly factor-like uncharacterized protein